MHAPSVVRRARAPQSAPAGHRPAGPGRSRHPSRVHSPGRRYTSLRVIEPVVAAEHMSDGRTRARRTFPGQPRCALRARLSDEPDGRGTNGLRDLHVASRSESARNLSTGVPRQKGAGQRMARLSHRPRGSEAGGLIHPLLPSRPSKEVQPAGRHKLAVRPAGRRPGSSESGVGPLPPVSTLTYPDRCPPITHQHSPAALQLPCELPVSTDAFLQPSKPAPRKRPPDIAPI